MFDDLRGKFERELQIMKTAANEGSLDALAVVAREEEGADPSTPAPGTATPTTALSTAAPTSSVAASPELASIAESEASKDAASAVARAAAEETTLKLTEQLFSYSKDSVLQKVSDEAKATTSQLFRPAPHPTSTGLPQPPQPPQPPHDDAAVVTDSAMTPATTTLSPPTLSTAASILEDGEPTDFALNAQVEAILAGGVDPVAATNARPSLDDAADVLDDARWAARQKGKGRAAEEAPREGPGALTDASLAFWGMLGGGPSAAGLGVDQTLPGQLPLWHQDAPGVGDLADPCSAYAESDVFDPILASVRTETVSNTTIRRAAVTSNTRPDPEGSSWRRHLAQRIRARLEALRIDRVALLGDADTPPAFVTIFGGDRDCWIQWKNVVYVGVPGVLLVIIYHRYAYTDEGI